MPLTLIRTAFASLATLVAATAGSAADGRQLAGDPRPDLRAENRERTLPGREVAELGGRLAGKSEFAVLSRLGRPDRATYFNGGARLDYRFGREWITVRLRDGKVIGVGPDERQTGVREDDLVLPPGVEDLDPIGL